MQSGLCLIKMSPTLPKFSVLFIYPESLAPSRHSQFEKSYGIQRPLNLSITPHHTSQGSTQKALSPSFPLHLPFLPLTLGWGAQSRSSFDLTLCLRWFDPWSYSCCQGEQTALLGPASSSCFLLIAGSPERWSDYPWITQHWIWIHIWTSPPNRPTFLQPPVACSCSVLRRCAKCARCYVCCVRVSHMCVCAHAYS